MQLSSPSRTGRGGGTDATSTPAPDGGVWATAQFSGRLGWFDPASGRSDLIALGAGSSPHGEIQGPDKAAWITDGGLNAIVRIGWPDRTLHVFPLPKSWTSCWVATFGLCLSCRPLRW